MGGRRSPNAARSVAMLLADGWVFSSRRHRNVLLDMVSRAANARRLNLDFISSTRRKAARPGHGSANEYPVIGGAGRRSSSSSDEGIDAAAFTRVPPPAAPDPRRSARPASAAGPPLV